MSNYRSAPPILCYYSFKIKVICLIIKIKVKNIIQLLSIFIFIFDFYLIFKIVVEKITLQTTHNIYCCNGTMQLGRSAVSTHRPRRTQPLFFKLMIYEVRKLSSQSCYNNFNEYNITLIYHKILYIGRKLYCTQYYTVITQENWFSGIHYEKT